ncbi:hypothetical protein [Mesorhizobium sp. WSM2239]|uniref:Uncharacterized protein n=2 Tax=unclassified Mesorhizobium TaxID=325217 RepID=A0AAU8DEY8_9HYPH
MSKLDQVFEAYRDYTRRSLETRKHRQSVTGWSSSPLKVIHDWSAHDGTRMISIPAHLRLPDVNPLLIDFNLQMIWARTLTGIDGRLRLIDHLYENLSRPRQLHLETIEITRLVLFKGDPRDGAPKEAAP